MKGRPQTDNRCAVCDGPVERGIDEYCDAHSAALGNLRRAYAAWLEAYGKIPFREYLARLSKLSETGEQVRELAEFLVQHPGRWDKSGP